MSYTVGLLLFNGLGVLTVFALQRLQGGLPTLDPGTCRPCRQTPPSTPWSVSPKTQRHPALAIAKLFKYY